MANTRRCVYPMRRFVNTYAQARVTGGRRQPPPAQEAHVIGQVSPFVYGQTIGVTQAHFARGVSKEVKSPKQSCMMERVATCFSVDAFLLKYLFPWRLCLT